MTTNRLGDSSVRHWGKGWTCRFSARRADGQKAVQKAEELKPNLILLDIGLPTLNGFEAARQIRKLSPESKIIFVTQESAADVVQEGPPTIGIKQSMGECFLLTASAESHPANRRDFFNTHLYKQVMDQETEIHSSPSETLFSTTSFRNLPTVAYFDWAILGASSSSDGIGEPHE